MLLRVTLVLELFPRNSDVKLADVEEQPAQVQYLDLNTNLIISE